MVMNKLKIEGREVFVSHYDSLQNESYLAPTNSRGKFNTGSYYDKWVRKLDAKYGVTGGHELSVSISGRV